MTDAERLTYLKMIQEDIYVCSLDATFLQISKECALTATIKELEKKISDNAQTVDAVPIEVLDKIRAEIEALIDWHDCPIEYDNGNDVWYCEACNQAIRIIDKYRGEEDETDN